MNIAILLSGGTGSRAGFDIPKQYVEVNGKPVISYCVDCLKRSREIDLFIVVADLEWQDDIIKWIEKEGAMNKFSGFALPGENRQLSILNGLKAATEFASSDTIVMVHDAARPLLTPYDISEYIASVKGHDGVIPVLPMKDTVYISEDGKTVSGLLNRSQVYAGQAPEFFVLGKYLKANLSLGDGILKINGSTEPAILAGMDIAMVPGNERNFKITTKSDFERFKKIILS